jgi:hypothetical protein
MTCVGDDRGVPVALPDIGYLARSVNYIIDNENEREVASHPFRFVDSMRYYITRKPPTYALANYIGEPYQVFQLWASDRTTGTEHENRSPQGERQWRVGCYHWT